MFKYTLMLAIVSASLIANESKNTAVPSLITNESTQPLSESINLMIKDLEKGIELLDNTNVSTIKQNLYTIDAIAKKELVKLVALVKIKKIGTIDPALVQQLASIYKTFHEKLLLVLPQEEISETLMNFVAGGPNIGLMRE